MPNYCENALLISGDEAQLKQFLDRVESTRTNKEHGIFNEFAPCPQELLAGDGWYNWRCLHWGTKWDVGLDDVTFVTPSHLTFDTAWGPPTALIRTVSKLYPDLTFVMAFSEQGMGFAGTETIKDGVTIDETDVLVNPEWDEENEDTIPNQEWKDHMETYHIGMGG